MTYAVKIMDKEVILAQDVAGRIMSEHNVLLGNEVRPSLGGSGGMCGRGLREAFRIGGGSSHCTVVVDPCRCTHFLWDCTIRFKHRVSCTSYWTM